MKRSALIYLVVVMVTGLGSRRSAPPRQQPRSAAGSGRRSSCRAIDPRPSVQAALLQHAREPLSRLFLQLVVILAASAWRAGSPAAAGSHLSLARWPPAFCSVRPSSAFLRPARSNSSSLPAPWVRSSFSARSAFASLCFPSAWNSMSPSCAKKPTPPLSSTRQHRHSVFPGSGPRDLSLP